MRGDFCYSEQTKHQLGGHAILYYREFQNKKKKHLHIYCERYSHKCCDQSYEILQNCITRYRNVAQMHNDLYFMAFQTVF